MKITLTTLTLAAYAQAIKLSSEQGDAAQRFANWASKHNRNYNSKSQRDMRFGEWLIKDRSYNSINEDKQNTFTVGHNNMSDWTDAEFQSILLQNPKVVSLPEQSFAEILADQKGGKGGGETTCSCSKCGSSCGTCYDYGKIN